MKRLYQTIFWAACVLPVASHGQVGGTTTGAPEAASSVSKKAPRGAKGPTVAAKDTTTQSPGTPEGGALGTRTPDTVNKVKADRAARKGTARTASAPLGAASSSQ